MHTLHDDIANGGAIYLIGYLTAGLSDGQYRDAVASLAATADDPPGSTVAGRLAAAALRILADNYPED